MLKKNITNKLLIISIAIFLFGTGFKLGEFNANNSQIHTQSFKIYNTNKKNLDFSLFWEAWDKVEKKFVEKDKLKPEKMFYGAIKGMVASLEDPHTYFLTPEENKQSKDDLEGKFEGIGAQLGLKDNRIVIIAPLKKSPAEKAGARAGDYITHVDGKSIKGWTLLQAVKKIRGPKGTKVVLGLERKGEEVEIEIIRNKIIINSVELEYEIKKDCKNNCDQIAHLKLIQFGENTNHEWDKAINKIVEKWKNKEIKGLVLDLRDNPGGYLQSSVYLASEFLPQGKLVVKQESTDSDIKDYNVTRNGKLLDIPLVVLINKGSASASEILAGALRDNKQVKLIGEQSFGKGSVQEAFDLKKGAGIHVTVSKWILPNGDWINKKGIKPDIIIENEIEEGNTITKETDKQLEKAIEEVLK